METGKNEKELALHIGASMILNTPGMSPTMAVLALLASDRAAEKFREKGRVMAERVIDLAVSSGNNDCESREAAALSVLSRSPHTYAGAVDMPKTGKN